MNQKSVKMENLWQKSFFKWCWMKFLKVVKMISADTRSDVKQEDLVGMILYKINKETLSKITWNKM